MSRKRHNRNTRQPQQDRPRLLSQADALRAGGVAAPAGSAYRPVPVPQNAIPAGTGPRRDVPENSGMNALGSNTAPVAAYYPGRRQNTGQQAGVGTDGLVVYMPPGDPIRPVQGLDDGSGAPRQWSIPPGSNIIPQPRQTEVVTFDQMRALAATYYGIQLCEATMLRILDRLTLTFAPRPDLIDADDDVASRKWLGPARAMEEWWADPENRGTLDLHGWLKALCRDLWELDAVGVYHRRTRGGGLYGLELVAGDTLACMGSVGARVPLPPAPAYAQILYGVPAGLYGADQMDYLKMTSRTDSLYGLSNVERIILTVNLALRKLHYDLMRYTNGATPEGLLYTDNPALLEMTVDEVETWEREWNASLAGLSEMRVRTKVAPPGWHFQSLQQADIATPLDQYLLQVTVGAFGLTMDELGFTENSNRSTGQSQENVIYRNAVQPTCNYLSRYISRVVRMYDGQPLATNARTISRAATPTKPARGVFDARYVATWTGIDEPDDWSQRASAMVNLVQHGIIGPTQAKRELKLHVHPNEKEIGAFVIAQGGMQSLVFLASANEQADKMASANAAGLDAQTAGAQSQVAGAQTEQAGHEAALKAYKAGVHPETGQPLPHTTAGQQLGKQMNAAQLAGAQQAEEQAKLPVQPPLPPGGGMPGGAPAVAGGGQGKGTPAGSGPVAAAATATGKGAGTGPTSTAKASTGGLATQQAMAKGTKATTNEGKSASQPQLRARGGGTDADTAVSGLTARLGAARDALGHPGSLLFPDGAQTCARDQPLPGAGAAGAVGGRGGGGQLRIAGGLAEPGGDDGDRDDGTDAEGGSSTPTRSGPPSSQEEVSAEWKHWRQRSLRAARAGERIPPFVNRILPAAWHAYVAAELARIEPGDVDAPDLVRVAFETARRAEAEYQAEYQAEALRTTSAAEQHTGVMVAWFLPPDTAERVALPAGTDVPNRQPPESLHITLCFLGERDQYTRAQLSSLPRVVQAVLDDETPISGEISGVGRFRGSPNDAGEDGVARDPVFAGVKAGALPALRERVAQALKRAGYVADERFLYTPHVTLAYLPSDMSLPAAVDVPAEPVTIDHLTLAIGDEHHLLPLGREQVGTRAAAAAPADDAVNRLAAALADRIAVQTAAQLAPLRALVADGLRL